MTGIFGSRLRIFFLLYLIKGYDKIFVELYTVSVLCASGKTQAQQALLE